MQNILALASFLSHQAMKRGSGGIQKHSGHAQGLPVFRVCPWKSRGQAGVGEANLEHQSNGSILQESDSLSSMGLYGDLQQYNKTIQYCPSQILGDDR